MTTDTKTPAPPKGAGAWRSPAWYGRGMPMTELKRRLAEAQAAVVEAHQAVADAEAGLVEEP